MYSYDQSTAKPYRNEDGVMVSPPSQLTPQFVMSNKLPLYVIPTVPPQTIITVSIKSADGKSSEPLRIPRQKHPFCVTTHMPHDKLARGGRDLWIHIEKGVLQMVWPTDAEKLLVGQTKTERPQLSKWSTLNVEESEEVRQNKQIIKQAKAAEDTAASESDEDAEMTDPVNARVMDIVARTRAGEVKLDAAIAEFEGLSEIMVERDYAYAITNVKGGKLREHLQGLLAKGDIAPTPAPKKRKAVSALEQLGKKAKKQSDNVFDSSEPEMTDEEREAEAEAEALARSRQRIGG